MIATEQDKTLKPVLDRIDRRTMYTVREAAEAVGVSASLIYRAATVFEELGYVRLGVRKGIKIPGTALREWVKSRWGADAPRGAAARRNEGTLPIDGSAVRHYRDKRGMTLKKLSQRSGVPVSTLSRIERSGRGGAHTENVEGIARALRVKPKTLARRPVVDQ